MRFFFLEELFYLYCLPYWQNAMNVTPAWAFKVWELVNLIVAVVEECKHTYMPKTCVTLQFARTPCLYRLEKVSLNSWLCNRTHHSCTDTHTHSRVNLVVVVREERKTSQRSICGRSTRDECQRPRGCSPSCVN